LKNWSDNKMSDYVRMQLEEAFGPDNRWFCSEHYCGEVNEPDLLLEYYIKHGGAERFRRKFRPEELDDCEHSN